MTQPGDQLIGKTVASVEISDSETLITFSDGSEIAITIDETGGDYGSPFLDTVITTPTN